METSLPHSVPSLEAAPALNRVGLTIDLSQGYTVDEVDERFLLLHLSLPVPPLQVPEEQEAV